MDFKYEKNGDEIYKKSFAIIRSEANLDTFSKEEEKNSTRSLN